MAKIKGNTVLITGGASGIGRLMAAMCLQRQAKQVVLWDVNGWSESLRLELEQQNRGIHVTTVTPSYIATGMFFGVKPPVFIPMLDPAKIAGKIIHAITTNKLFVRAPFMVKLIPLFKGILPTRWFDFIAGKVLGVYGSMNNFKGHEGVKGNS